MGHDLARALQDGGARTKAIQALSLHDLGGIDKWLDILRNRHVDVAVVPNTLFAKTVPAFDVLNLPFEVRDLRHAGRVTGSALERRLQAEAARGGFRLLGFTWRGGTFFSRNQCLVGPADVRGRKMMDGREHHATVLTRAGAAVVVLPGADFVAAYERGLADSAMLTIELLDALGLGAPRSCLTRPGTAPFMILPEVIVAVLGPGGRETLDGPLVAALGTLGPQTTVRVQQAGEALERKYAKAKAEIASIGDKEREEWGTLAAPLTEEYVKRVEAGRMLLGALRELR
jgi:TRAP-type C4-dicarboxylate transport system substrate-binding protein